MTAAAAISRKVQIALNLLNGLVAQGMEYPDAHSYAATTSGLTDQESTELSDAYDTQDLGTFAEKSSAGLPL